MAQATEREADPCQTIGLDPGELALDHLMGLHEPEGLPEQPMPRLLDLMDDWHAD